MAWGDPTTLKFDVSKIAATKQKMEDIAEKLVKLNNDTIEAMATLENEWNTPTGKKFLKEVDTDWSEQVKKYIEIIATVSGLLAEAESIYATLEDEASRITF